jgi:hypothetical protein
MPRPAKKPRLSEGSRKFIRFMRKSNKDSAVDLYPILELPHGECVGLPADVKLTPKMLRTKPPEHVFAETRKMLADPKQADWIIRVHMMLWECSRERAIHDLLLGIKWVLHHQTKRQVFNPNVQYINPRAYFAPFMQEPKRAIFQQGIAA